MAIQTKYREFFENYKSNNFWNILPKSIREINDIFKQNGKKLYVVGGAIRDFLNNDKPKDFDLCTDAMPDEVINMLGSKYRTNLQGKAFGVVVVYTEDEPKGMEIATFRQDVSKGRNPIVKLGVTIEDDVKRRDLTYNALFFDIDNKEIIDLVGGVNDMQNKLTRMVGDPLERIEEDSLRILRAFRFAARYNTPLDTLLIKSIKSRKNLENLDPETGKMKRISQERICQELVKAFEQAKNYSQYLEFFNEFDMWDQIFPGLKINTEIKDTKYIETYFANLFKFVDSSKLLFKLKNEYKLTEKIDPRQIVFLLDLLLLSYDNALELYKKKVVSNITVDMILEWYRINNITSSMFVKFLDYKPSVNTEALMQQGFLGNELGDMIKKLERESFVRLVG